MKRTVIFGLLFMLVLPGNVFAWGMLGHRVTGGIAEHYLNAKAKAAIKKLLGNETLAMAGNWADFIKSDRSYDYLGSWHYINLDPGLSRQEVMAWLKADNRIDLYTRINYLIRELKLKNADREKQVFYLKLLIHFIGDAHQPMHMGEADDRGGNNIKLYWFGEPTNLHRVWDEQLIAFQQLSYTEHVAAINFVTPEQKNVWMKQPPADWIFESYQLAQKLYTEVKAEDKLMYNYNYGHVGMLNQQLLKGGVRLAGVLNEVFGN